MELVGCPLSWVFSLGEPGPRFGHWFVGGRASVALGGVREVIGSESRGRFTPPSAPTIVLPPFATPGAERTRFAVLPEAGVTLGAVLTEHARVHVGYNFLYLSSVTRAGDHLSLIPTLPVNPTDFWAQGIAAGLEWRF